MNKPFVKSVIFAAVTVVALGLLTGMATTGTDTGATRAGDTTHPIGAD